MYFTVKRLKMPLVSCSLPFFNADLNPIFTFIFSIQEFKVNSEFGRNI